eukprot:1119216-Amphidinium_carterae.1
MAMSTRWVCDAIAEAFAEAKELSLSNTFTFSGSFLKIRTVHLGFSLILEGCEIQRPPPMATVWSRHRHVPTLPHFVAFIKMCFNNIV